MILSAAHSDLFCLFVRSVEGGVGRAAVGEHDFQEGASLWPGLHAWRHWYTHINTDAPPPPSSSFPLCMLSVSLRLLKHSWFIQHPPLTSSNMTPMFHPQLPRKCVTCWASMWPTSHEPSCPPESRSASPSKRESFLTCLPYSSNNYGHIVCDALFCQLLSWH